MASSPPKSPSDGSSPEGASAPSDASPPGADKADGYFTRPRRDRTTRKSVIVADKVARFFITIGGIGTIISVLGVALFLFYVVLPLFLPAKVGELEALEIDRGRLVSLGIDEYQLLGYTLLPSGQLEVFRIDDGRKIEERQMFEAGEMTASAFPIASDSAAFGTRDGEVKLADIGFETEILDAEDLPADVLEQLRSSEDEEAPVDYLSGVLQATPGGQYRFQKLRSEVRGTAKIGNGPVRQITHVTTSEGPMAVALVEDYGPQPDAGDTPAGEDSAMEAPSPQEAEPEAPAEGEGSGLSSSAQPASTTPPGEPILRLQLVKWAESTNFLTGETGFEMLDPVEVPRERDEAPAYLALTGAGVELLSVWEDGYVERLNIRDRNDAFVTETGYLLEPGSGETLSFFAPILGGNTFLWGSSSGKLAGGFTIRAEEAEEPVAGLFESDTRGQGQRSFARTKQLATASSPAVSLGSSSRSRLALTGFENGEIRLFNITNATQLKKFALPEQAPVIAVTMSPKEDGLLVATPDLLYHADLDPRFPEAGIAAFFRPVWYEGYAQPEHIWQSSSASDDFEMKLGLMPLIFGTLKATLYSMLFGAPLALLAAIFTSELLHARARAVIKPGIEFMASLPSVVLGFLAALVFAPYVEKVVPAALGVFLTLPLTLLIGAHLWQLLPSKYAIRWQNWRFGVMVLLVPVGVILAGLAGPTLESWFFAGDIKGWLNWSPGGDGGERFASSVGGWMLLVLPLSALTVAVLMGRSVNPLMRSRGAQWDRRQFALADLIKFLAAAAFTFGVALVASSILSGAGFDPRGGYLDTYVQRNALIVGFVMGFAIIPIIYTIAEDALSTVPEHLRSASLGAGATTWQTAVRIVIPTAMSGLFSALMIGLGRAVGETMIVLMAAGNTPVMEWNIFEGFRTLSANIAVELPEAVKGDTHYRTLFLAALVLFLMTFAVNTVAEVIRQRFRKRAYQL